MQPVTAARNALWGVTVVVWLALVRLGVAFLTNELDWRYVAGQSRRDAPWYYRLAGVWGGSEGSLLLFAGIVGLVASIAAWRVRRPAVLWFATATVVLLTAIDLWLVSPFGTLDAPALRGFGLTPILEHPAMAVHPPLLYVGLACALGAAMFALDGRAPTVWLRAVIAVVALAMAIGGLWSYVEQGWGGYWAWDPVENTSLMVWLAAVVALHVPERRAFSLAPWMLVLVGATLVRSGATPSIHGFSEQASVGWALLALTLASGLAFALLRPRATSEALPPASRVPAIAGAVVLVVVALGTLAPVAIDVFGSRPAAVRGEFFARTVGLVALVCVPFLALRIRRPHARLAHVGVLVLLVGIGATTFDQQQQVTLAPDLLVRAAGLDVTARGVSVEPGPRADVQAVVADVEVNGRLMRPSLVAYPERGGVLAETAMVTRPWRDIQVTLVDASDSGAMTVVVRQRPLMWLVWFGVLLTTAGVLTANWRRPRRTSPTAEPVSSPTTR